MQPRNLEDTKNIMVFLRVFDPSWLRLFR